MKLLYEPWPWYLTGAVLGLMVPALLIIGNKSLGISSTLRQICAACIPANIPFLKYDWRQQRWNLFFAAGLMVGGFLGAVVFASPSAPAISRDTVDFLSDHGLQSPTGLMPAEIFNWSSVLTLKGFLMMVAGGFMIGFGTRYARGCTSGHGIFGMSALQWPSLVATASFFLGGILFSRFILPYILLL